MRSLLKLALFGYLLFTALPAAHAVGDLSFLVELETLADCGFSPIGPAAKSVDRRAACQKAMENAEKTVKNDTPAMLNGRRAMALAMRSLYRADKGDAAGSRTDWEAAKKLDAKGVALILVSFTERVDAKQKPDVYAYIIKLMDKALEADPASALAYRNRGMMWLRLKAPDQALDDLNRAVALAPGYAEAYKSRSQVWQARGDNAQALADLNKVISLNKSDVKAYEARAGVHRALGNAKSAAADLATAKKLLAE